MIQEHEIKDYIKEQFAQGQTVMGMVEHLLEHTDILTFIITKHNGDNMNIPRRTKISHVKKYVLDVQKYG
jgi:hypothetical protein